MRKLAAFSIALLVLLGALWLVLREPGSEPIPPRADSAALPAAHEASPAPLEDVHAPSDTAGREPTPVDPVSTPAEPATAEPKLAEIRGRFVFEGDAPAGGVAYRLRGWTGNQERELEFGVPKEWKDPEGASAADGTFSIRFDPPRAFQFVFEGQLAGFVEAGWRWHDHAPGLLRDLGDIVLQRAGTIVGRVVDPEGRPVLASWMIYADGPPRAGSEGIEPARVRAPADARTAEFRLEDVPSGMIRLKAFLRVVNWIEGPTVEVRAGETSTVDFVYSGPDFSRRITVVTFARPFHIFDSAAAETVLTGPGIDPRKASKIDGSSQSFAFEDVPPGRYTVSIDDPKFLPWSKEGVEPGASVDARLKGASSVRLAVIDSLTKEQVPKYSVRVRFDESNWRPNEFEIKSLDAVPPADGVFDGLIPVVQTLIVQAPGYSETSLPSRELKRGEMEFLTVEMHRGATVTALALEADGKSPVADVVLSLDPLAVEQPKKNPSLRVRGEVAGQRKATTDANGRAVFASVAAGRYVLRGVRSELLRARLDEVLIEPRASEVELRLTFPPSGWLSGRLVADPGASFEGLYVQAEPEGLTDEERQDLRFGYFGMNEPRKDGVAADGSFRIGPLPVGPASIQLRVAYTMSPTRNGAHGIEGGSRPLGEVEIAPGSDTRHDFDVRSVLPGRVRVRATLGGAAASSAVAEFDSANRDAPGGAVALLDARGEGLSGLLFPGLARAIVRDLDGAWRWSAPGEIEIRAGKTIEVVWDFELVTGTLTLVDLATSAPLVRRELWIGLEGANGEFTVATTDAQGKVEIRLAPGSYRISLPPHFVGTELVEPMRDDVATVEWKSTGPVPAVVKVEAAAPR